MKGWKESHQRKYWGGERDKDDNGIPRTHLSKKWSSFSSNKIERNGLLEELRKNQKKERVK